jgi:hypothetical protein
MFFLTNKISYFLIFLFVVTRLLFIEYPFWGLEYEDSFIYTDTGRFMGYNYDFNSMPFKCQSCLDGSYLNCYQYGSYGGHLLTIPFLLTGINSIFGFYHSNIFILNLLFSVFVVAFAFFNWEKFNAENIFSLNTFLLVLTITPFYSVFNTSGLAETISSFFVIAFILSIYKANESDFKLKSLNFWLVIVFLFLSVITKRENFILLVILYSIPIIRYYFKQKAITKSYLCLASFSSIILLGILLFIGLFDIEKNEGADIGHKTFSIDFLIINLKQFLSAITNISYWGLTGFLFIFSIAFMLYKRTISKLGLMSLLTAVFYIVLYAAHYRSYYQVVNNISHPFETLRYSVNYLPAIALFISTQKINFDTLLLLKNNFFKYFLSIGLVFILLLNVISTRIEFSQDENTSRIEPVKNLLSITAYNDIIITDIPIIFHCYADENLWIVDVFSLENQRFQELLSSSNHANIYFLKPKDFQINSDRYGLKFETNSFTQIPFKSENFELFKYTKQ